MRAADIWPSSHRFVSLFWDRLDDVDFTPAGVNKLTRDITKLVGQDNYDNRVMIHGENNI